MFDGLIMTRLARFATGMVARATFELNGPTTPRMFALPTMSAKFCAPFWGSCTPFTESSYGLCVILNPLIVALSWIA